MAPPVTRLQSPSSVPNAHLDHKCATGQCNTGEMTACCGLEWGDEKEKPCPSTPPAKRGEHPTIHCSAQFFPAFWQCTDGNGKRYACGECVRRGGELKDSYDYDENVQRYSKPDDLPRGHSKPDLSQYHCNGAHLRKNPHLSRRERFECSIFWHLP